MEINNRNYTNSESGNALLMALFASGVIVFVATALASLIVQMKHQQIVISQKLEISETKNILMQTLADSTKCSWQLEDMRIDTTNLVGPNASSPAYSIPALYAGINSNSAVVVSADTLLPGGNSSLEVSTIQLKNIVSTGKPFEFTAVIQTNFKMSGAKVAFAPIQNSLAVVTNPNDPPESARISYCSVASSASNLSLQQVCTSVGGKFNQESQQCSLSLLNAAANSNVATHNSNDSFSKDSSSDDSSKDNSDSKKLTVASTDNHGGQCSGQGDLSSSSNCTLHSSKTDK